MSQLGFRKNTLRKTQTLVSKKNHTPISTPFSFSKGYASVLLNEAHYPHRIMHDKPLLEDILMLGRDAVSSLIAARHELKTHAKQRVGGIMYKLDLVSREEFDAAFAMLAKARDMQEDLASRLSKIESHLKLSGNKKTVKTKKTSLPIIKTKKKFRTKK